MLRVKNRFAEPTSGGWADFMISFRFRSDPNQHVCEVRRSGVVCDTYMEKIRPVFYVQPNIRGIPGYKFKIPNPL